MFNIYVFINVYIYLVEKVLLLKGTGWTKLAASRLLTAYRFQDMMSLLLVPDATHPVG